MAAHLLTPRAAAEVDRLLDGDLAADGKPSGRTTLSQVATWPDEIRLLPATRDTGPFHVDAMPVCAAPDRAVYCPDGRCASAWFDVQRAVLADRTQTPRARNEALKWIVHLVGDIHQPLHAAQNDDFIGDGVQVTWFGARSDPRTGARDPYPYHLHTTWDRLIPDRMLDERGGDRVFVADLPDAATRRAWATGSFTTWIAESHELARAFVYPSLPAPTSTVVRFSVRLAETSPTRGRAVMDRIGDELAKRDDWWTLRTVDGPAVSFDVVVELKPGSPALDRAADMVATVDTLIHPLGTTAPSLDWSDADRGPFTCGRRLYKVRELDDDYYRAAAAIASEQLRKAGVRLAQVLNATLDPVTTP